MKGFFYLFLLSLCTVGNAQDDAELLQLFFNPFDSFEERYLKGDIRSIRTIYSQISKDGKRTLLQSPRAHLEEFSEFGKITSYYEFMDKPVYFPVTSQEKNKIEYWPNGKLKKITWPYGRLYESFDIHGEQVGSYEWQGEFNSNDDFYIKIDSIKNNYNSSDRLVSPEKYEIRENSVELVESTKYFYNQSGKIIKAEIFGGLININFSSDIKPLTTMSYSYDNLGNITKFTVESSGSLKNQSINFTYQNGLLVKSLTISDVKRIVVNYENGWITRKTIQYNDSGYTLTYNLNYQLDSIGNWVESMVYSTVSMRNGGNPRTEVYYVNREIQYY